jgi:ABC-type iron transport system FetAB permease component
MATEEINTTQSLLGVVDGPPLPQPAQRALTFGLLVSALRCTIQYVVLPFVLPWIGVTAAIPAWVMLVLGALAIVALTRNVRTLWRMRHARRWSYLFLALMVGASLLLFSVIDLRTLLHL